MNNKYKIFCLEKLKENNARITNARIMLIDLLAGSTEALKPYDIAKVISEKGVSTPVSTVYRVLELFLKLNLVHFLREKQAYIACKDFACTHAEHCHHQFTCQACEQITEVHLDDREFIRSITEKFPKLEIKNHYLELAGLCGNCR
jgi:Fe2+ or Zn2+ uptake regulation protein